MAVPLAYKLRPEKLEDIVGQDHILNQDGYIYKSIERGEISSLILFGPPGSGKTSIALIIAKYLGIRHLLLNATSSNKKDLENAIEESKIYGNLILIIDEVHRLNKDKQDILLPHLESGVITLIGATTANPYHSINPAIRSRCHLFEVKLPTTQDIVSRLKFALTSEKGLNNKYTYDEEVLELIAKSAGGDIRFALNNLEIAAISSKHNHIDIDSIQKNLKVPKYLIDKDEDGHYDSVSALQKSIRGSDVHAALYYLARLIAAGDLESINRRLLVIAYEDIGLANPAAAQRTYTGIEAAEWVGFPEASIILSQIVIDLALSPKSKSAAYAISSALEEVNKHAFEVPRFMRLTPHGLSENEKFPYHRPDLWEKIAYLPEPIKNIEFYQPWLNGSYEKALVENYRRLNKSKRTSDIKTLIEENPKK